MGMKEDLELLANQLEPAPPPTGQLQRRAHRRAARRRVYSLAPVAVGIAAFTTLALASPDLLRPDSEQNSALSSRPVEDTEPAASDSAEADDAVDYEKACTEEARKSDLCPLNDPLGRRLWELVVSEFGGALAPVNLQGSGGSYGFQADHSPAGENADAYNLVFNVSVRASEPGGSTWAGPWPPPVTMYRVGSLPSSDAWTVDPPTSASISAQDGIVSVALPNGALIFGRYWGGGPETGVNLMEAANAVATFLEASGG